VFCFYEKVFNKCSSFKKRKRKLHWYTPQWNVLHILMATIHAKPYNQRIQGHLWCAGHFILMHSAESIHSFIHSSIVYSKSGGSRILWIICTLLQTLPGLKNSYIQKGMVQVEVSENQNWANIWSTIDIYTWESYWNPNSNMLEPHWPQHDSPISPSSIRSLPQLTQLSLHTGTKSTYLKNVLFQLFYFSDCI